MASVLLGRDAISDGLPNPRGKTLANLSIAFACLSFLFVSSRLLTRYFITKVVGADDYLIIISLMLAISMAVSFNEEVKNGFGFHTSQVDAQHRIEALKRLISSSSHTKWFYVAQLLYKVASVSTKISILVFYVRIFTTRNFKIAASITGGVVIAYSVGSICATIWQCNVVSCTIVRMIVVGPAVTAKDTMYYQCTSNSWTFLEVNVAIICACLPMLRAPLTMCLPWMRDKSTRPGQYVEQFSRDKYASKNTVSHNARGQLDNNSDEEFILQELGSVRKTTDVNITYEDATLPIKD
ncbi:hypothetical protein OIDMADRAFT_131316 [Oidiodendron maius Zn]|uniref:Rhodopsin domain-containing protein n=1 Tax=Oidiodendron maius (strain Zn) TaxID=913774 RepID=A0A0C3H314_OIDMZ|nr:hypothetical protein OIDMADRAFT_131316 [Oidiodendron maius Zn]